ncbi:Hypothetical_protein [Hexamita inflata]|uniref:Hypothetical_protein n=1 Tax=Hexamita inflata TaxID=28002 RepID=A0AA86PIG9_9EUKA|nr:Hypothetical protein HINF_LOCUS26681 [Hexamita inflata]
MTSFAVFGLNSNNQFISESLINVTITYQIIYGSLICIRCDINVKSSNLIYEVSGSQISTLMQQPIYSIFVEKSSVQYRFNAKTCGGLVFKSQTEQILFSISETNLIGFNYQENVDSGNIISHTALELTINVYQFSLCSNIINQIGLNSISKLILSSQPIITCKNLCNQSQVPVYGKCQDKLVYGYNNDDGTSVCIYPFYFNLSECSCSVGYLQNNTLCIDIFDELTGLQIKQQLLQQYQIDNFTNLNNLIQDTYYKLQEQFQANLSSQIQSINSTINSVFDNLSQIQLQYTKQFNDTVQTLNTSLQNQTTQINNIYSLLNVQNANLSTLFNKMQTLTNQVSNQQTTINNQQNTIQNQQIQINSIQTNSGGIYLSSYTNCAVIFTLCSGGQCATLAGSKVNANYWDCNHASE